MSEPYRFGGPIPESVARLKSRRVFRASSLYAGAKKIRGERFDAERAGAKPGVDWYRAALEPFEHRAGRAGSAGAASAAPPASASDPGTPR